MKKLSLLALCCLSVIALGSAFLRSRRFPTLAPRFWLERMPNARKAGDLIFVANPRPGAEDDFYLFIWDAKNPWRKAIPLGQHLYSSTQGSDSEFWSKDKMMCAQYSESVQIFDHPSPWTTGYDWTTHRVLRPDQIAKAFKSHGGQGQETYPTNQGFATPQEVKLFNLNVNTQG